MRSFSSGCSPRDSLFLRAGLALFLSFTAALLAAGLAAQDQPAGPQPKKPLPVEEEDPNAKPTRPVPRLDESQQTGLASEAEQATNPEVKALFRALAVPYDVVTLKSGRSLNVAPLPRPGGARPAPAGTMTLQPYDERWQPKPGLSVSADEVASINPYEQIALSRVDDFLKLPSDKVKPLEALQAAEKVLAAAIRFHDSTQPQGKGTPTDLDRPLRDRLLQDQLDQLRLLADQNKNDPADPNNWDAAFDLAVRLAEAYPRQEDVRARIAEQLARFVTQALEVGRYADVHLRLRLLEEQFPRSPVIESINQKLRNLADARFKEAVAAKESDPTKAMRLFQEAESIWPRLPDLRNQILQLSKDHPILYVGVRQLPDSPAALSPLNAGTDTERQMVQLLYESLVKPPLEDPKVGERYVPGLAQDRPRLIPLGRQFQLVRDAFWSNGERVTAADVRATWQTLAKDGRADLVEDVRPGEDAFQVNFTLSQGYIDPLALMTFKVLPAAFDPAHPVGSGPYQYRERKNGHDVFIASSSYHRAGKSGRPLIPEVHFLKSANPLVDFTKGQLHVLLDLDPNSLQAVKSLGSRVNVQTLRNRRIYFLAVNHRKPVLADNPDLRRAFSLAIDRERILNDVFRDPNDPGKPHRALNGPYPPDSWASAPDVGTLFDASKAKALAAKAAGGQKTFSLKYPKAGDDDVQAERACQAIRDAVKGLGAGLDLQLEPRSPAQLRREVEGTQDYELAYYWYDYPSDSYNLYPLFDPKAVEPGGRNFLAYRNDSQLVSLIQQSMEHRDFVQVQSLAHQIHQQLISTMPLIPLWQLDTQIAISADVVPREIDPLLIFTDLEDWEMARRS